MAVIEFDLVSGYIPKKADLKQIVGYGTGLIKRYEVDGSKVTFYIDEFSPEDLCIEFQILREVDMEDVKPGSVKVYDYYQPEFSVSKVSVYTGFFCECVKKGRFSFTFNIYKNLPLRWNGYYVHEIWPLLSLSNCNAT